MPPFHSLQQQREETSGRVVKVFCVKGQEVSEYEIKHFIIDGMGVALGKGILAEAIETEVHDFCLPLVIDNFNFCDFNKKFCLPGRHTREFNVMFCILSPALKQQMISAFDPSRKQTIVLLFTSDMFRSAAGYAAWRNTKPSWEDCDQKKKMATVAPLFIQQLSEYRPRFNDLAGQLIGGINLYRVFRQIGREEDYLQWAWRNMLARSKKNELELFTSEEMFGGIFTGMEKVEMVSPLNTKDFSLYDTMDATIEENMDSLATKIGAYIRSHV